jgi:hypothetical protein
MAVSANTLFHFTNIKGLKGILSSKGFYCQYSDEHFENILPPRNPYRFSYIPMTSFCDLTIMQLSNDSVHRESFGEFGIGLTKDWGIRNRVSPLMYVHKSSQQTRRLHQLIKEIKNLKVKIQGKRSVIPVKANSKKIELFKERTLDIIDTLEQEMIDSFKFIKPYKGNWHKGKRVKSKLTYYNEREWRYCPLLNEYAVLSSGIKGNKKEKNRINKKLKDDLLTFDPSDVKFIIIRNNKNINEVAEVIEKMNVDDFEKNLLITKIITFEKIHEDF